MSRPLPLVTPENAFFWQAGADGVFRFQRCEVCHRLRFPVAPVCPYCRSEQTAIADVGGTATVIGVTVNHQQWTPKMTPPYVVAIVAIDEDPAIRLTTNVVDVEPGQVHWGCGCGWSSSRTRTCGSCSSGPPARPTGSGRFPNHAPSLTGEGADRSPTSSTTVPSPDWASRRWVGVSCGRPFPSRSRPARRQ